MVSKGLQAVRCGPGENRAIVREEVRTEDGQPYSLFAPAHQGAGQIGGAAAVVTAASVQPQQQQQRPVRVLSAGASSRVKTASFANSMELSAHMHSTGNLAGDTSPTAPLMPMVLQANPPSHAGTVCVLPKFEIGRAHV